MTDTTALRAITDVEEWSDRAACRGMDDSVFFHPDNERGASKRRREAYAKSVCAGCPVRPRCLAAALASHEPFGIWGGTTPDERDAIAVSAAGLRAI